MRAIGRVLIIEDEPEWVESYRSTLAADGYEIEAIQSAAAARALLGRDPDWDVIILDMKLRGSDGPSDGLDLIGVLRVASPFAKILLVTAYAEWHSIQDAFQAGVYDFIEKPGRQHPALLQAKVRNAWALVHERRMAVLDRPAQEAEIQETHRAALIEKNSNKKGAYLEHLMVLLFRSIPGFGRVEVHRQNDLEEIDLAIHNGSTEPPWKDEGTLILVECKHWSRKVGSPEFREFREKLRCRFGRCKLGFFIALGGFAETLATFQNCYRTEGTLMVPIDGEGVAKLIQSSDRNEALKRLYEAALI